jgi:hypothetical protein
MTKQEIFDKVWQHFVVEKNRRSAPGPNNTDPGLTCYYRHPSGDGRRCAVGLLISDEHYVEALEGLSSWRAPVIRRLEMSGIENAEDLTVFLRELQKAHDCSDGEFVDEQRLRFLAEAYALKVPSENA